MEKRGKDESEDLGVDETPEDVAALYSWINLHGAKYRDFSASRRESRAQLRHHAAEQARQQALIAQAEAKAAAEAAEAEASKATAAARHNVASDAEPNLRHAEEASRIAAAERVEFARRADAAAAAEAVARREEREIADAHASAERQSAQYSEMEIRRRMRHSFYSEEGPELPGEVSDPYAPARNPTRSPVHRMAPERFTPDSLPPPVEDAAPSTKLAEAFSEMPSIDAAAPGSTVSGKTVHAQVEPPVNDTPASSYPERERVAARWYALKGVFEQPVGESIPARQKDISTPLLVVMSLAGGVGKTSLVATVGRSLSSLGEKVLLSSTTSYGLLPFYFGASELRQGTVRTFSPPSGSTDAPVHLVSYDINREMDNRERDRLIEEMLSSSRGMQRSLIDLSVDSVWILRHLARFSPAILVPLAPDMNSVISLQAIEKFFYGLIDADGRPLQPYYIINQFDAALPLHLDVQEVLRRQLGGRLLPFVIHRAPEVSEALAEGMTVIDYAPESQVSRDYLNLAVWLRNALPSQASGFRNVRWSER